MSLTGMKHHFENHNLVTEGRAQLIDLTDDLTAAVGRAALVLRAAGEGVSGDAASSPEAAVLAEDERTRLLAALDGLPDDARLVLAYRYLLDLSEAETAAVLGVRRGTVKSRTSRALERLRESYD
jgi:RNA polymerase sigma factor (sigma-70 family)